MSNTSVLGVGAVVPPEAKAHKIDLGDKALEVTILDVFHNEGDDCRFVRCQYPDGFTKHHQVFLTQTTDDLFSPIINTFRVRYGKSVVPSSPMAATFEESKGSILSFTEN